MANDRVSCQVDCWKASRPRFEDALATFGLDRFQLVSEGPNQCDSGYVYMLSF